MSELIQVEFRPGGHRYTYATDKPVAVGDVVMVPTHTVFGEDLAGNATVVALGSAYTGEVKSVISIIGKDGIA